MLMMKALFRKLFKNSTKDKVGSPDINININNIADEGQHSNKTSRDSPSRRTKL